MLEVRGLRKCRREHHQSAKKEIIVVQEQRANNSVRKTNCKKKKNNKILSINRVLSTEINASVSIVMVFLNVLSELKRAR